MSPVSRKVGLQAPGTLVVLVAFRFQPLKNLQEAYQSRTAHHVLPDTARRKSSGLYLLYLTFLLVPIMSLVSSCFALIDIS